MTVLLTNETVTEVTQEIWAALLAGYLQPAPGESGDVSARIRITGAWNGATELAVSRVAARRAAGVMFGMADEEVTEEEVADAIGELVNVVGGNLKAVLPGPTYLSLPEMGHVAAHEGEPAVEVGFTWADEPVVVTIWSAD